MEREKRDSEEDGMYDNPSYNDCGREPVDTVVYEQPRTSPPETVYNIPRTEEDNYHKVLNPLYLEATTPDTSLRPQRHDKLDQDPYYATPSLPTLQPQAKTIMYQSPRVVHPPQHTPTLCHAAI